jgi:hypothetical protein
MPRGPAPQWRQRKEPVVDAYILAAISQAGGVGKHDGTGHYGTLVIDGLADKDEAAEYKRALFRCALWLNRNQGHKLSISRSDIDRDGTGWKLTFRVTDKTHARRHMLEHHGPDRSKWAYNPRGKASA